MEEKIHFIEPQKIDLTDIELKGRILDIGGGGEGIIGQLKGLKKPWECYFHPYPWGPYPILLLT